MICKKKYLVVWLKISRHGNINAGFYDEFNLGFGILSEKGEAA